MDTPLTDEVISQILTEIEDIKINNKKSKKNQKTIKKTKQKCPITERHANTHIGFTHDSTLSNVQSSIYGVTYGQSNTSNEGCRHDLIDQMYHPITS